MAKQPDTAPFDNKDMEWRRSEMDFSNYSEKVETKKGERIEVAITNIPANFPVTQKISMKCLTEHQYFHQEEFASTMWASPWQVRGALGRNAVCSFEPPRSGTWYVTIHFGYISMEGWEPKVNIRVISK